MGKIRIPKSIETQQDSIISTAEKINNDEEHDEYLFKHLMQSLNMDPNMWSLYDFYEYVMDDFTRITEMEPDKYELCAITCQHVDHPYCKFIISIKSLLDRLEKIIGDQTRNDFFEDPIDGNRWFGNFGEPDGLDF
jgi:hypothetical protein